VPTADGFAFVPLARTVPPPWTHGIGRAVEPGEHVLAFTCVPILPFKDGGAQVRRRKNSACVAALKLRSVDKLGLMAVPSLAIGLLIRHYALGEAPTSGAIMAKRKKASKPKRVKLRRGNSAKRGKPRKVAKAAAAKRAKPKRAAVKRAARREVAPAVEVPVEGVEQQEPGAAS
jgi:hypothetical protein